MALTQGAVSVIKSGVQAAKKLLMREFDSQLQQFYGIRPDGNCLLVEELTSKDAAVIETARLLRQRLKYLEEGIADKNKSAEAVRQLVREQAFTVLNRFAAIRMAEERNIIRETIRNAYNSEGFQVYDQLTGGAKTAEQFLRYTWYIKAVCDELAIDLPAVFDRFSPYALLFPSENVVLELLEIINAEKFSIYREPGKQPVNLWTEDETIGWIYQYYNSREEISKMRDASGAPRNSRELAVRNQFFTPRYVVQFLVDNTLGRQWYEMTKGQTSLVTSCQYMVKREQVIFIGKGEEVPKAKIEGAHYVEFRKIKDPRAILMLDPACGSMHFGLYCFDIFEQIYIEAWDKNPDLMQDLREKYLREDFLKQIPSLILRHNIHGVDIDPRAIQIAGLSLWLRAQKTYANLNLQPAERPAINKSNLVVAEPLPGNENILKEFTSKLSGPIGKLVRTIWDKMKLAGETGLLLKIEEELKQEIELAKQEWESYKNSSAQVTLFDAPKDSKAAEMAAIYGKGQNINRDFFNKAEEQVLKALENFAENAEGEDAFQKLLFAEDTVRGFAFIELCRKRYDVVLMNPPFGAGLKKNFNWQKRNYPASFVDLLSVFVERGLELSTGKVGAITSRNILLIPKLTKFRKTQIVPKISVILDLGWPVMDDATVQAAAYILDNQNIEKNFIALNRQAYSNKEQNLIKAISSLNDKDLFIVAKADIFQIPHYRILYQLPLKLYKLFSQKSLLKDNLLEAKQGLKPMDDFRFVKAWVEVTPRKIGSKLKWRRFAKGGGYSIFLMNLPSVVNYGSEGAEMQEVNIMRHGQAAQARQGSSYYYRQGGTYSIRTKKDFGISVLPQGFVIGGKGVIVAPFSNEDTFFSVGLINSTFINFLMKLQANDSQYDTGIIERLPFAEFHENERSTITTLTKEISELISDYYSYYETSEYFRGFFNIHSVNDLYITIKEKRSSTHALIQQHVLKIDEYVDKVYEVNSNDLIQMLSELTDQETSKIRTFDILSELTLYDLAHMLTSFLIGLSFNRYTKSSLENNKTFLLDERGFNFVTNKNSLPYLAIKSNGFEKEKIFYLGTGNPPSYFSDNENIMEEIIGILNVDSMVDYLSNPNGFFNDHISKFTLQRKVAPIYWPISTPSNSFVVLLYYHSLNKNTFYEIVNELVDPKINEVKKEVEFHELKGSSAELNKWKNFYDELQNFKQELLRVAQIPFEPNQDDGVLITAAPLHNLFQHSKWKKITRDVWIKLEKGEYDWSHLAYSIWPERVRKKAKIDLSIAIAHGLEEICEIKPKENKEKKQPEVKKENQMKIN